MGDRSMKDTKSILQIACDECRESTTLIQYYQTVDPDRGTVIVCEDCKDVWEIQESIRYPGGRRT